MSLCIYLDSFLLCNMQKRETHKGHKNGNHSDRLRLACGAPQKLPKYSGDISCPVECKIIKTYVNRTNFTFHPDGSKTCDGLPNVKVRVNENRKYCYCFIIWFINDIKFNLI